MGHVSAFVAIASQLILIKSRAMLPRPPVDGRVPLADEGPDPEAELRARLILYRAFRDAGTRLLDEAAGRVGLFQREPAAAHAAGIAGARPPAAAAAVDGPRSCSRSMGSRASRRRPPPPPETIRADRHLDPRAAMIREALRGAPSSCSRSCCAACATGSWSP